MKNTSDLILFVIISIFINACSTKESTPQEQSKVATEQHDLPKDFVFVKGGSFVNTKSNLFGKKATMRDFYISRFEVTQKEWRNTMQSNPSKFKGDSLPVEMVSWYDCIEYCNKRSISEGLSPYYNIDKNKKDPANKSEMDDIQWTITFNDGANGYRLPTEAEWEYAASGGQQSKSYTYSGSDSINQVAWYWQNSGDKPLAGIWSWPAIENNHGMTHTVGKKQPNELGLYDMSGNVREWCEDWYVGQDLESGLARVWRGGGWMGADVSCAFTFRHSHEANGSGPDQGFRLCRSNNISE